MECRVEEQGFRLTAQPTYRSSLIQGRDADAMESVSAIGGTNGKLAVVSRVPIIARDVRYIS
ncbi:hypothetical protein FF011L_29720 [Roseimaritima multifibrata]|uniref:Uncharacterized protein n=1 Tax=Roseimaritima multifibrata TaxID=1930274 RepID=A0A517MH34_9BACT|nr:hypothetical protein FF011L_29720 [Roseimaritima multifibrata]